MVLEEKLLKIGSSQFFADRSKCFYQSDIMKLSEKFQQIIEQNCLIWLKLDRSNNAK